MSVTEPLPPIERQYRVRETAEILDVEEEMVLSLIATRELLAVNVAKNPNGHRPRWRVPESELAKFLLRRRTQARLPDDPKPTRTPKRREVEEFYK